MTSFRKGLGIALAMVLCLTLTGCKRHVFTVYQEGNYISETVVESFTKETGIKVKLVTGNRTPQAFEETLFTETENSPREERVQAALMGGQTAQEDSESLTEVLRSTHEASIQRAEEKAAKKGERADYSQIKYDPAEYDVVLTDGATLGQLIEEELLLDLNTEEITNRSISEEYRNLPYDPENAYTVTTMWEYLGLLVNTELAGVHPTRWDILWQEEYAGQIIMPSLPQDCAAVALLAKGLPVGEPEEAALNAAFDALEEQKPLVQEYHNRDAFLLMENDMAVLYPCYSGDALEMMGENPALAFVVPQGRTVRTAYGYGIAADSRFPTEAAEFVDYMCREDSLAKNGVYSKYAATSQAARDRMDGYWSENPVLYPNESMTEGSELLTTLPAPLRELCEKRWQSLLPQPQQE